MKFIFKAYWMQDGRPEPLLEPPPVDLRSIENARELAERFVAYIPVHSMTIEAEDGSIFERWLNGSWRQNRPC
jgi:hypothetical protein